MIGYLRCFKPLNCIVEPKVALTKVNDLRVSAPWPELRAFADSFDMDNIEQIKYIHVPFAVILIKQCDIWREQHDGQMPSTFAQKQEFRAQIKAASKFTVAENFEEAYAAYLECFKKQDQVPNDIQMAL